MSKNIPLYEAIRPRGDRDVGGADGETLHQVADILERQESPIVVDEDDDCSRLAWCLAGVEGSYDFIILRDAAVEILNRANERPQLTLGELLSQENGL